jgi:hypothetical protein
MDTDTHTQLSPLRNQVRRGRSNASRLSVFGGVDSKYAFSRSYIAHRNQIALGSFGAVDTEVLNLSSIMPPWATSVSGAAASIESDSTVAQPSSLTLNAMKHIAIVYNEIIAVIMAEWHENSFAAS